jgi:hypothetical protein
MLLAAAIVVFAAIGFLVGRVVALAVPLVIWSCFFTGLATGWWGSSLGDAWEYAFALTLGASVAACVVGVAIRRALLAARPRRSSQPRRPA